METKVVSKFENENENDSQPGPWLTEASRFIFEPQGKTGRVGLH